MSLTMDEMHLGTLAGGKAAEQFERALLEVIASIDDPNVEAKAPRAIVLTVKFLPGENRDHAQVLVSCQARLPGARPATSTAFLVHSAEGLKVVEHNPKQMTLGEDLADELEDDEEEDDEPTTGPQGIVREATAEED